MSKPHEIPAQPPLRELSADELSDVGGGWAQFFAPWVGRWLGGQATGGFGNIPNDREEAAMAGYSDGWPSSNNDGYGGYDGYGP